MEVEEALGLGQGQGLMDHERVGGVLYVHSAHVAL